MNHRFSDEGLVDYRTVAAQYETTAKLGSAFAAEVIRYVSIIEVNPQGFSRAPRCPRGRDIRVVKIGRFDYLLYHEVLDSEVVTLAVVHAKRRTRVWKTRKP